MINETIKRNPCFFREPTVYKEGHHVKRVPGSLEVLEGWTGNHHIQTATFRNHVVSVGLGLVKGHCRKPETELDCLLEVTSELNLKGGIKMRQIPGKGTCPMGTNQHGGWLQQCKGVGGREGQEKKPVGTGLSWRSEVRCYLVGDAIWRVSSNDPVCRIDLAAK